MSQTTTAAQKKIIKKKRGDLKIENSLTDAEALSVAVADVVRRHDSLRTRYPEHGGTPVQVIVPAEQIHLDLI
uniref:hypothetical protein n=1 Tax=Nocardia cyriacigeorgica TaxID=135487 RepID=UPI00245553C1